MKNALIGYTGFIGSNLRNKIENCKFYNSKNIKEIEYKNFNNVYFSGNDSRIWYVNKNHREDLKNIQNTLFYLKKIKCKKFILISTIEVYDNSLNANNEKSKIKNSNNNHYGNNRFFFEKEIKKVFKNYIIIRLPVVYGNNLKKNLIFDIINDNNVDEINKNDMLQFYPVRHLFSDINKIKKHKKISLINLASEPILISELLSHSQISNKNNKPQNRRYNMNSIFTKIFNQSNYRFSKNYILRDIKKFIQDQKK